jgi:nucleoside 2-deoxyribosyltransferase
MKIAYVAGPYRGKSKIKLINRLQVIRNIVRARTVAKELWRQGYAALCPHSNTALFDGAAPDETFLQGDIDMLAKCDLVVLVRGWDKSNGTKDEVIFAKYAGIPVYEWDYTAREMRGMEV